jgi:hypothetical protein
MRRFFRVGVCVALLFGTSGCGSAYSKNEEVIKDLIKAMTDLGDALESVKDKESAKAAAAKINEISDRLDAIGKKAEDLPKLTKADSDKLKDKYESELKKQAERMQKVAFQAGANSGGEPEFLKAVKRLESVGKNLQKIGEKLKAK